VGDLFDLEAMERAYMKRLEGIVGKQLLLHDGDMYFLTNVLVKV
jgi:hypothetical protein